MELKQTYTVAGREITISTGKIAKQAQGAVLMTMGGTTMLAAVTMDKKDTDLDFFPLSVEYIEKLYARGAINSSRFQKREGLPSEEAIIKARQVDHSIRSLFPKSFKRPTSVVLTVLSYDQVNDPEILAVSAASLALMISGVPYFGPSSGSIACLDNDRKAVINPDVEGREEMLAEYMITGVDDRALSIEGWSKEVTNEEMDLLLDESMKVIKEFNAVQNQFYAEYRKMHNIAEVNHKEENSDFPAPESLIEAIKSTQYDAIKDSIFQPEKADRNVMIAKIKEELVKEHITENSEVTEMQIANSIEYIAKKILREHILKEDKRRLERGLKEIRPMDAEVDILPTVHGSALFNRGLTQSLSIVTLGPKSSQQTVDDMEGESTRSFMHHYNMPPYASGEAGRFGYHPGRREIGHGAIGYNALKNMIPSQEDFPYTIRVVSEIMNSNGSTSMAATCASCMAMMAAGVPLKEMVAGIGVGLITTAGDEDTYKLLLDIEGIEDFYGDMDFKVTGTKNGITAIQYENKLRGVKLSVLKEAFRLAGEGRMQVLDVMSKAISEPRPEVAPTAPKVDKVMIDVEDIGELIGPSGKNIKDLVARAEEKGNAPVDIVIDQDGTVTITASNSDQMKFVKDQINGMFERAQEGQEYVGIVDRIMPYGVFVDVSPSISGLLHVSEMFDQRFNGDLALVFKVGDELRVKVSRIEDGKVNFNIKGLEQTPDVTERIKNAPNLPEKPREEFRRDDRRPQRRY